MNDVGGPLGHLLDGPHVLFSPLASQMLLRMAKSGLFISWATPAAKVPTEAILADWMSCACVSRSSFICA